MGMDVYGKNPANEAGEYFRANVWYWHPLWAYVENVHPEIAELVEHAHTNDGDGLNATKSKELAKLLKADLGAGKVAEYEEEYRKQLAELPMEDCSICNATGIRDDEIGKSSGWDTKELPDDVAIIVGRAFGSCNACSGLGKRENFGTNYPFEESVVAEFAEFLEHCGGFEIC